MQSLANPIPFHIELGETKIVRGAYLSAIKSSPMQYCSAMAPSVSLLLYSSKCRCRYRWSDYLFAEVPECPKRSSLHTPITSLDPWCHGRQRLSASHGVDCGKSSMLRSICSHHISARRPPARCADIHSVEANRSVGFFVYLKKVRQGLLSSRHSAHVQLTKI